MISPRLEAPSAAAGGGPAKDALADAPLLVTSFPRSGSSLLRAMLDSHPELAVLPEPRWMMGLLKSLSREPGPLSRELALGLVREQVDPDWLALAGLQLEAVLERVPERPTPGGVVAAAGRAYAARTGKPRWGVKNPGADFRLGLPLLRRTFPSASFVFLARDPRDVYLSQVRAGWRRGQEDLELFCLLWTLQMRRILGQLRAMGGHVVRYEELVERPVETLADLCRAAGLSATRADLERMLEYRSRLGERILRNPIHEKLGGPVLATNRRNFARELSPTRIRRAELLVAPLLRRLGYAREDGGGGRRVVADAVAAGLAIGHSLVRNVWGVAQGRATISGIKAKRKTTGGGQT